MTTRIAEDGWLSEVFGHPVYGVQVEDDDAAGTRRVVAGHASCGARAFYFAKVPTTRVDIVRELSGLGMYTVDTAVTLTARGSPAGSDEAAVSIGTVRPEQGADVVAVAGSCFRFSRFHLDPLIADATADEIKRRWVRSYLEGTRGEALLVATVDGTVAGFLAVLARAGEPPVRVLDLIGVAGPFQRRGIGRALVGCFLSRYGPVSTRLEVGTQAANVASLRLYQQAGFAVDRTAFVMHLHTGDPR